MASKRGKYFLAGALARFLPSRDGAIGTAPSGGKGRPMLKLIIGNKVYSSWSLRGWLAVKQSGLPFEEVVVSLYDDAWTRAAGAGRPRALGAARCRRSGPVTSRWDSLAIIDYLDAQTGGASSGRRTRPRWRSPARCAAEMHSGYQPLRRPAQMNLRHVLPATAPSAGGRRQCRRIVPLWEAGAHALRRRTATVCSAHSARRTSCSRRW